jgi:D-alanyl-D-alanine carboxypeptidase (penicillin-binding protein 5/6)
VDHNQVVMGFRNGIVAAALAVGSVLVAPAANADAGVWPGEGQAAYVLGNGRVHRGSDQHQAPIASMAKVMTGYLVLKRFPLRRHAAGFTMTVRQRDVDDWHRRVARDESTVPVRVGERLTERQALAALLLPSANNIAIMLARRIWHSVPNFVRHMNKQAATLHMTHTVYTDPSGYDATTRSTPTDQIKIARAATHRRTFRAMVRRHRYRIPVAGTVRNKDTLLGTDGFVGIKTGSMSQSGGCFMFDSLRIVHGHVVPMFGVVMGQYGGDLIQAGLGAAKALVDRVAPHAAPV